MNLGYNRKEKGMSKHGHRHSVVASIRLWLICSCWLIFSPFAQCDSLSSSLTSIYLNMDAASYWGYNTKSLDAIQHPNGSVDRVYSSPFYEVGVNGYNPGYSAPLNLSNLNSDPNKTVTFNYLSPGSNATAQFGSSNPSTGDFGYQVTIANNVTARVPASDTAAWAGVQNQLSMYFDYADTTKDLHLKAEIDTLIRNDSGYQTGYYRYTQGAGSVGLYVWDLFVDETGNTNWVSIAVPDASGSYYDTGWMREKHTYDQCVEEAWGDCEQYYPYFRTNTFGIDYTFAAPEEGHRLLISFNVGSVLYGQEVNLSPTTPETSVPEPTSFLLLGTGLGVFGLVARRRKS